MQLHFRKTGSGRPLLILHGLFGSLDNWQTLAVKFADSGYAVYSIDLRNHGRSPHLPLHTFEAMSNDLLEFVNQQFLEDVFVIGHSMGGKTAMRFALDHSRLVSKLVIADIAPRKYPVLHDLVLDALRDVPLETLASRNEAQKILTDKIKDAATVQFLLKNLYRVEGDGYQWRFNLRILDVQIENMSEAITSSQPFNKPVLFLKGEKSEYIRQEDEPAIHRLFPNSKIFTAPGAGHWIHAENPQWFFATTINFFSE